LILLERRLSFLPKKGCVEKHPQAATWVLPIGRRLYLTRRASKCHALFGDEKLVKEKEKTPLVVMTQPA
jgi:hypothetical protein